MTQHPPHPPHAATTTEPASGRMNKLTHLETIRELYPRCRYCGHSMRHTPLHRMVLVPHENRIAHRACAIGRQEVI